MAAINASPTIRDKTAKAAIFYYRGDGNGTGLSIGNGDTLNTGMKRVFEVRTNKPAAVTGWTSSGGVVTFVTTGALTGVLVTVVGQA